MAGTGLIKWRTVNERPVQPNSVLFTSSPGVSGASGLHCAHRVSTFCSGRDASWRVWGGLGEIVGTLRAPRTDASLTPFYALLLRIFLVSFSSSRQGIRAALQLRAGISPPTPGAPRRTPSRRSTVFACAVREQEGARMSLPLLDSTLWGDWSVESPMGVSYACPLWLCLTRLSEPYRRLSSFSHFSLDRVLGMPSDCARAPSTFRSCAVREHEGTQVSLPLPSFDFATIVCYGRAPCAFGLSC